MGLISRVSSRTYRLASQKTSKTSLIMIFVRGSENTSIEMPATEAALFEHISAQEKAHMEQLTLSVNGAPFEFGLLQDGQTIQVAGKLLGGKVHGSLARAGKVKGQTPKVEPEEKRKKKTGRAARRTQYNRRFVIATSAFGGKRKGPNCQADRTDNK